MTAAGENPAGAGPHLGASHLGASDLAASHLAGSHLKSVPGASDATVMTCTRPTPEEERC